MGQRQITTAAAERTGVTVESLIREAEQARLSAMQAGQYSEEKGILSGKRVERSERGSPGDFEWIENASAEELQALIDGEPDSSAAKH
jgi:hypothetical protein